MTTMSLFSFRSTRLTPNIGAVANALKIDEEDKEKREARVFEKILKIVETSSNKQYMFIPVIESKTLVFTKDDSVFALNNKGNIMPEKEVARLFGLRDARKGRLPTTVVSAVVSLGAFEVSGKTFQGGKGPSRVRMTADLQQPSTPLLKAETMRVFCIGDNDDEEEPEHAA